MSDVDHADLLREQTEYYKARASEYDEWFYRQGRYDRGAELNRHWYTEVETLRNALGKFKPAGEVLELACGTGIWTCELLKYASMVTAVDAAAEMLATNRQKTGANNVNYVHANLFDWKPDRKYDVVFFAFWLSHVPPERFKAFWKLVAAALKPNGRFFLIDSLYESTSTARDHQLEGRQSTSVTRRLNDGREFRIVKVFYNPAELAAKLTSLGWRSTISKTPSYFIYGEGTKAAG